MLQVIREGGGGRREGGWSGERRGGGTGSGRLPLRRELVVDFSPASCTPAGLARYSRSHISQDQTRTGTYYQAIVENRSDFEGKTVMDVGAGSGILSLFAAQVGGGRTGQRAANMEKAGCQTAISARHEHAHAWVGNQLLPLNRAIFLCRPELRRCMRSRPLAWPSLRGSWPTGTRGLVPGSRWSTGRWRRCRCPRKWTSSSRSPWWVGALTDHARGGWAQCSLPGFFTAMVGSSSS